MRTATVLIATGVLAGAVSAQPVTISFASDTNDDGPTFAQGGDPFSIRDGAAASGDLRANVTLLADFNGNAPGAGGLFDARLVFNASLSNYQQVSGGGFTLHSYSAAGSFDVVNNSDNSLLLRVIFTSAVFTSGSPSFTSLGPAAALQGIGPVSVSGSLAANQPVLADWAFTFTNLRGPNQQPVAVDPFGALSPGWTSEGSFSGTLVPAPGCIALAACAGLLAGRRRRT